MFGTVFVLVSLASVGASRIEVHHASESESQTQFGASCDSLQTSFHNRVVAFQESVDAVDMEAGVSRATQTRYAMRTYGILRTLRRAKTCSWVINNDSEDIDQARGIAQALLAGNPCADAARSELEAGTSAETPEVQVQSIPRALSILTSDNCEVSEVSEQTVNLDDEATVDAQLSETEAETQDGIDELAEASLGQEGSFIQMDKSQTFRSFMRTVGVVFLMLFMVLACSYAVAMIAFMIILGFSMLLMNIGAFVGVSAISTGGAYLGFGLVFAGGAVVPLIGGLVSCSYELYNHVLPRLTQ